MGLALVLNNILFFSWIAPVMCSFFNPQSGDERNSEDESAVFSSMMTPQRLADILVALQQVGEFGEVHLVVHSGKLRFLRIVQSHSFAPDASDDNVESL